MDLSRKEFLKRITTQKLELTNDLIDQMKPRMIGHWDYFYYSDLFLILVRTNRLRILQRLVNEYINENLGQASNDKKYWLPIFTLLKAIFRAGKGQRNHILPYNCIYGLI
jgi:hypothetical protein